MPRELQDILKTKLEQGSVQFLAQINISYVMFTRCIYIYLGISSQCTHKPLGECVYQENVSDKQVKYPMVYYIMCIPCQENTASDTINEMNGKVNLIIVY